jgi:outer membrane protein assembly factor BamA
MFFMSMMLVCCQNRHSGRGRVAVVRKVRFEGVSRFNDSELREYLHIRKHSTWTHTGFAEKSNLYKGRIREDKKRLIQLYRSAGYFDMKVIDVRVEKRRPGSKKVTVIFVIDEGKPVRVDEVKVNWSGQIENEADVTRHMTIRHGGPADVALLNASRDKMVEALKHLGYAFAKVDEHMEVIPEDHSG